MNSTHLYLALNERKIEIARLLEKIDQYDAKAPEGRLRISAKKDHTEYYHVTDIKQPRGIYLRKNELTLAQGLAQKDYNQKLKEALLLEQDAIDKLTELLASGAPELVYEKLSKERRVLVKPFLITDSDYAERWAREDYEKSTYKLDELVYETERGEYVRSKSERDIANLYYELNIPYRYEQAVYMRDGRVKYPDFTALDVKRRRVIYHEHMGMLDSEEYRIDALKKINIYRENGIFTGYNLIVTHETRYSPMNIKNIRKSIKKIFELDAPNIL